MLDRDQRIAVRRSLYELAPDPRSEHLRTLAWNHQGSVTVARMYGTLRDGGAFENPSVAALVRIELRQRGHGELRTMDVAKLVLRRLRPDTEIGRL